MCYPLFTSTSKFIFLQNYKLAKNWIPIQWRIQDFPEEGAPTPRGAPTYDFAKFS